MISLLDFYLISECKNNLHPSIGLHEEMMKLCHFVLSKLSIIIFNIYNLYEISPYDEIELYLLLLPPKHA